MNIIQAKSHINSINPYRTLWDSLEEGVVSMVRKTCLYSPSPPESKLTLADRVIDWSLALPFTNYEREIDAAGSIAKGLDWGVFGVVAALQGIVAVDELFKLHFLRNDLFSFLPATLRALSQPLSGFFFGMGIIESGFELVSLSRVSKLLYRFEKSPEKPIRHLEWIKEHYFTIRGHQAKKIAAYIEQKHPAFSQKEKSEAFEQIADKSLQIKFERLSRRITPGLAKGVSEELDGILSDLKSNFSGTRATAHKKAQVLLASVTKQVKNKILVHILALMSLACTVISMTGLFIGVAIPAFFIVLGATATLLMAIQFLAKKKILDREVEQFYANFKQLKGAL